MFATALLLTVLSTGAAHAPLQATGPAPTPTAEQQQATSGIVIAAEVEGRLAIYDRERRLVVELDKPAGRQLQLALEPGVYEARLAGTGPKPTRIQIGERQQLLIDLASFAEPDAPPHPMAAGPNGHGAPSHHSRPLDGRHRIEIRFGGWGDGWYDQHDDWYYGGSAQAAFGLEYLNFVRNDLGVGIGLSTLARGQGDLDGWDNERTGQATCSIPIVVRWYPVRRMTRMRSVEPYATAGIGPVFGVNAVYRHDYDLHHWDDDVASSAHVGTTIGGRVGGGVDFRLGSVFTLGIAGAWNWNAGFSHDLWDENRPGGGEFSVVLGWQFGR